MRMYIQVIKIGITQKYVAGIYFETLFRVNLNNLVFVEV